MAYEDSQELFEVRADSENIRSGYSNRGTGVSSMKGPEAYVYILKKRNSDVFFIGSSLGVRWHRERFPDYELWGRVRVDWRMRRVMVGRMVRQARAAGWILINQNDLPEYGPHNEVDWVRGAIRRGEWEALQNWLP